MKDWVIECFPSVGIANENLDSEEAKILNKILYAEKNICQDAM